MQLNVMWPCERLIGKYSIYTNIQSKHAQRFGPRCWCCTHATATVIRYSACTGDWFAGVERHLLLAVYKEPTHSHSHSLSLERHTHAAVRPAVDVVECSLVTPFFLRVYCVCHAYLPSPVCSHLLTVVRIEFNAKVYVSHLWIVWRCAKQHTHTECRCHRARRCTYSTTCTLFIRVDYPTKKKPLLLCMRSCNVH